MNIFFDTSTLVAAIVQSHPRHHAAFAWLARAKAGRLEASVSSHTLAELYAVLTTLPVSPRISPGLASRLIHENVIRVAKVVSLAASEYSKVITRAGELGLSGGIIYDALIARAAEKAGAEKILTLNLGDFERAWPAVQGRVIEP